MPAPASVRIGPAEIALTRMPLRAEIDREIAHRGFERRLGDAHDVVVRHRARRRRCRSASPCAPPFGISAAARLARLGEGEAGDHHGAHEILARGVGVAALELVLVGKARWRGRGNRASPSRCFSAANTASTEAMSSTSHGSTRSEPSDCGERLHALAERLALIGEGERRRRARRASWRCPRRSSGRWRPP